MSFSKRIVCAAITISSFRGFSSLSQIPGPLYQLISVPSLSLPLSGNH